MIKTLTRTVDLRDMLSDRRRELQQDVHRRVRDGRGDRFQDVRDEAEQSDANISEDIDFALLQLKAETLSRIDVALSRLHAGEYGLCYECGAEISEVRLRALPFAVRCKTCEDRREQRQTRDRRLDQQAPPSLPLFRR